MIPTWRRSTQVFPVPKPWSGVAWCAALCAAGGCQLFIDDADRDVYSVTRSVQQQSLGLTPPTAIERERSGRRARADAYRFDPSPVDPEVPEAFRSQGGPAADPPPAGPGSSLASAGADKLNMEDLDFGPRTTLAEVLQFAEQNARDYRTAREDLYLQALDLTLERFLWTPQFMSTLSAEYTEFPSNVDIDRALDAVADVAVEQRLPYGGQIVARWVGTLVRDLERHVSTGESGAAIIEANIPLLRGAGPTAYESRYREEREMIYAVRAYERFRRVFVTRVANSYFDLLSARAAIANAIASRDNSKTNYDRVAALAGADKAVQADKDRAEVDWLQERNRVIDAIENYESGLDQLKLLIGMPTDQPLDLTDEFLEIPEPEVDVTLAVEVALASRLDLVTQHDRIGDAQRQVDIAENGLLPDLNLRGSVRYDTRAEHRNAFDFREDDETWNVGIDLEIPLNRKAERNAYRAALIGLRRAQRGYELGADQVRLEVRRALRQIRRDRFGVDIQSRNIESNATREERARILYEQGDGNFLDLSDARNDLRSAKDAFAEAQSRLRQSILQARLATGTLRVRPDGDWQAD